MDWSRIWKKIIIVLLTPIFISAKIMCNDGTRSPSCDNCHGGCCSGHGGCANNYKFSDSNNSNNYTNSNHAITSDEWYEQNDDQNDKMYFNKPIKKKSSSNISKIIFYIVFIGVPILKILISIIIDISKYFKKN